VLGASNRPDLLDPALLRPGRFDVLLEIPLPDKESQKQILAIGLRGKPVAKDVDVEDLAAATDGFSGAEIQAVCRRAALEAVREAIESATGDTPEKDWRVLIRQEHLRRALEDVRANRPAM